MSKKTLIAFIIILLAGSIWINMSEQSDQIGSQNSQAGWKSEIKQRINNIDSLEIKNHDKQIKIQQKDGQWVVSSKQDYPANIAEIRGLLRNLAEIKVIEKKTANPEKLAVLELATSDSPEGAGTEVEVKNGDWNEAIIIGKSAQHGGSFIRHSDQNQSWLSKKTIALKTSISDWLQKDVLHFPKESWTSIQVNRPDGNYQLKGEDGTYTLSPIEKGKELKFAGVFNAVAEGLSRVKLEDVKPASSAQQLKSNVTLNYHSDQGVDVIVKQYDIDDSKWYQFDVQVSDVAGGSDDSKKTTATAEGESPDQSKPAKDKKDLDLDKARETAQRVHGWLYKLPAFKSVQLDKKLEDFIKDKSSESEQK
ncbi:MAG: DUF4340 domain-containing protein [bacterium]